VQDCAQDRETVPEPAPGQGLLDWYDANARVLAWRVGPAERRAGTVPDPYHVWLSEIMLQQTTVAAVEPYFARFTRRWPTLEALAEAPDDAVMAQWAGLGYYARARNLVKCARIVRDDFGGRFPSSAQTLMKLPGIGPYTAAAIAAIAFDRPETVVDGNVERVMARFFAVRAPLDKAKARLRSLARSLTPESRPGDHAQALMDLGATICTPRAPRCSACPWKGRCKGRALGIAGELPRRRRKQRKPVRHGIAYLARRDDGAWLLERRPENGLLGGMLGWPGTAWGAAPTEAPPLEADWQDPGIELRHTFTHFHLRLQLRIAGVAPGTLAPVGEFVDESAFARTDLPSVMRKAYDLARARLCGD